ncbi:flagellar hook-associated protein FlgK [Selenomonas sputigena]|uniref:flagellar hook-associated protein FlgK n=1 Tax=Selenomonas sputigena TaxID=69823 RepID=UPI002230F1F6|nr:flagellar hook-associated protein FlgK [Selenomonas sputigena]UZD44559.1 flagellar hook-associated protein FlgK [Selenomonas sputigena]
MVRGIYNNQLSLDTVGHNITNANTEGYSRQRVNPAATRPLEQGGMFGGLFVGTGVDSESLTRARDFFADKQYWQEEATESYAKYRQKNYDKIEAVFNDSKTKGLQNAMHKFYSAWNDLSVYASDPAKRVSVVEAGKQFADRLEESAQNVQKQLDLVYREMDTQVKDVNEITQKIVELNKNISLAEANGAMANDLRDKRDLLVDKLSGYMSLHVYEMDNGMYQVVSGGASIVNGISRLELKMDGPVENKRYGVNDYSLVFKDTNTLFTPGNGSLQAAVDSIKEDKAYMDKLANIAATFMTQFNDQHRAGAGIDKDKTSNLNFFGRNDKYYVWDKERQSLLAAKVTGTGSTTTLSTTAGDTQELQGLEIIKAMKVSAELVTQNGELKVAARGFGDNSDAKNSYVQNFSYSNSTVPPNITGAGTVVHTTSDMNGTADGSNAVLLTNIFNMEQKDTGLTIYKNPTAGSPTETRPTGTVSLNNYYNSVTSALGIDSNAMDTKVKFQQDVMTQIEAWRTSVSGVNWNEELSNMIKFQQGYSACARCMTTMDEMLDRLVNNTGLVGR